MFQKCSLCGQDKILQDSHIIPKFVGKWIKETSATGFLTQATNGSKRIQDLNTKQLLCSQCEERFSKFETYFANKIFHPFHKTQPESFDYGELLEKFVVSLSWRILKTEYDEEFQSQHPHFISHMNEAESHWREFLLGNRPSSSPFENHVLFLDFVEPNSELPSKFNWYTLRGVDATLGFSKERVFTYVKLPWMVFVTSIFPKTMNGWEGTIIHDKGTLKIPQLNKDAEFGRFLLQRAKLSQTSSPGPSKKQSMDRLTKAMKKNRQKFLESETLTTMIFEKDQERKEKMKNMPKTIIDLVDEVILRLEDNPTSDKSENRLIKWNSRRIADALANLSEEEANMLDTIIMTTIQQARLLNGDAQMMLKTNPLWIIFMVHPNAAKNYQKIKIQKECNELKIKREKANIPLAIFAMNPSEKDVSWECGFVL